MHKDTYVRCLYGVLLFLVSLGGWVMSHWAGDLVGWLPEQKHLSDSIAGTSAVYRVCFASVIFHVVLGCSMLGLKERTDARSGLQDSHFVAKFFILIVLAALMFLVPNEAIVALSWIALVGAGCFIILQLILLVSFAHDWAESWVSKAQADGASSRKWLAGLFAAMLALYSFGIVVTALSYAYFTRQSNCRLETAFVTINLLAAMLYSLLAISPAVRARNESSGLLQSATVAAYSSYLVLSALLSESDHMRCAYNAGNAVNSAPKPLDIANFVFGVAFTVASVSYSALRLSMQEAKLGVGEETGLVNKHTTEGEGDCAEYEYSVPFFHFSFAIAAMYVMMTLTSFSVLASSSSAGNSNSLKVNTGPAAMWIQIASSWLAILLYIWTLVAPVVFPDRDFSS